MRWLRLLVGGVAVMAISASLTVVGGPAGALDGGTTCRTYGSGDTQSVAVVIGDGDTRTTFRFRDGRLLIDGTDCGRILGRGIVDVLDGGTPSTNTLVFDASTRWSTGGDFAIPVTLNLLGHIQDGRADRVIVRGSNNRDVAEASGSGTISMRRSGRVVFSANVESTSESIVELRGGNDRFKYLSALGTRPIEAITVKGGGGDDVLIGNSFSERFIGGRGDDRLVGKGGADFLKGGKGRDDIRPGGGADVVNGGGGVDTCSCRDDDTVTNVP